MRKILMIGLVLGLACGCSHLKGEHKITPIGSQQMMIEPGKSFEVKVFSDVATEGEMFQLQQSLVKALESKGLKLDIDNPGNPDFGNPDFKIRIAITNIVRISRAKKMWLGYFVGVGTVETTVETTDADGNRNEFAVFAKAPFPTYGFGNKPIMWSNSWLGTTRMALEECAKRIADYLTTQPGA